MIKAFNKGFVGSGAGLTKAPLLDNFNDLGLNPSEPHLGHSFLALRIIIQPSHFYNVLKPTQDAQRKP